MPATSKYRPGSRHAEFRPGDKMSTNRIAWIRTVLGQSAIMYYDEQDPDKPEGEIGPNEYGPTIRLIIPNNRGRGHQSFGITALTLQELQLMRVFYNLLFDIAEPVVRERDRVADEAYQDGDDSYTRSYRQLPQFVVRERAASAYGQGLLQRLKDAAVRARDLLSSDGGVRGDGEQLADGEQEETEPKDHRSASY